MKQTGAALLRAMIFVKDMERMARFYREALELSVAEERPGWVDLEAGPARLALHQIPPHVAQSIRISDPPERRSDTPIKLIFGTGDLEEARARATKAGANMSEPTPWGSCDGVDPEGNVFQLVRL